MNDLVTVVIVGAAIFLGAKAIGGERHASANGIELIKQFESLSLKMYRDSAGLPTIGYGHLILKGEVFPPTGISKRAAGILLQQDMRKAEKVINELVKAPLTQNQYDAVVSLVFNIGVGAFAKSTMLRKLNVGDVEGAASEFPRWNKAGGRMSAGLLKRRAIKQNLFLTR